MLAFSVSVVSLMLIFFMQLTYIVWKQFKKSTVTFLKTVEWPVCLCLFFLLFYMPPPCSRCCSGQRSRGRPAGRGHGTGDAFSPRDLWRLHQVRRRTPSYVGENSKISFSFSDILFLHLLAASPPCSGSVMQTRGHTVLLRDSTPSLVLYTPLWWGFICLNDFFIKIKIDI